MPTPNDKPVYLWIGPLGQQAERFCRDKGIDRRDIVPATRPEGLRGTTRPIVPHFADGTWFYSDREKALAAESLAIMKYRNDVNGHGDQ